MELNGSPEIIIPVPPAFFHARISVLFQTVIAGPESLWPMEGLYWLAHPAVAQSLNGPTHEYQRRC